MKRKNFLKIIAVCFSFSFLLLTLCPGCEKETASEKIWILSDFTPRLDLAHAENDRRGERLLSVIKELGGFTDDQIELEFLPTTKTEWSLRIQQLRTEIMAGRGPDVYLLSSDFPTMPFVKNDEVPKAVAGVYRNAERLFPDLKFAMENKMFLPFDNYLDTAEWMDLDLLLPTVRDAGKTEEGQEILPITFTFPYAIYEEDMVDDVFPNDWNAALVSDTPAFRFAYGHAAQFQFSDALGNMVDYDSGTLNFSKEELLQLAKETSCVSKENLVPKDYEWSWGSSRDYQKDRADGLISTSFMESWNVAQWLPAYYDYLPDQVEIPTQVLQPIRNTDSGVTAKITACAAINRNTKNPKMAFRVLDILSSDYVQAGKEVSAKTHMSTQFFTASVGIPARNDLMRDNLSPYNQCIVAHSAPPSEYEETARQMFSEYTALRNEVTHARFYGTLDAELQTMYEACLEAESDEEIEKIVSKAYDTMLMILAES